MVDLFGMFDAKLLTENVILGPNFADDSPEAMVAI